MKYLVALDFSDNSHFALVKALQMMQAGKDELVVFSMAEKPLSWVGVLECNATLMQKAQRAEEKAARRNLALSADVCSKLGFSPKLVLSPYHSPAGQAIVRACEIYGAELLVLGATTSFAIPIFSTTTSEYCVEHASCPVLTVKHDHAEFKPDSQGTYEDLQYSDTVPYDVPIDVMTI
eukprot:TRINITY_DN8807_c0_g1_i3.p1 TRINITY_DN8807_c0_g1~~TRINITY_DN8807_c0_g1_i3.p1  ORF type:complete len:178 (-),score=46.94 TRINITY_DN8807_c0_g1_i3:55-588(-)